MKEAMGTARNLSLVPAPDGTMRPMVETIVILTEPKYNVTKEGLESRRVTSTIRFQAAPDTLRNMSIQFANWADEADALLEKKPTT
jgi:hypothetical protein